MAPTMSPALRKLLCLPEVSRADDAVKKICDFVKRNNLQWEYVKHNNIQETMKERLRLYGKEKLKRQEELLS
ncbi:hypothetical protein Sjap_003031 [Stephania japonica]|uniref:Uncharacterized protein n=1 Tax=Stephania japonica TaxID=461633 RepID=A0AAP0KN58_9MAGN